MGAAHDFSALVISARHRGRSIGDVAGAVVGPRVRTLFLVIISLLTWVVLAVFAYIIATLFVSTPSSIFPINVQIIVAMTLGWLVYKRGLPMFVPSLVCYALLLFAIFQGQAFVDAFPAITGSRSRQVDCSCCSSWRRAARLALLGPGTTSTRASS